MNQYYIENGHPTIISKSAFMQDQNLIHQLHKSITITNDNQRIVNGKYGFSQHVYFRNAVTFLCMNNSMVFLN